MNSKNEFNLTILPSGETFKQDDHDVNQKKPHH
jgi:hypothetical protein